MQYIKGYPANPIAQHSRHTAQKQIDNGTKCPEKKTESGFVYKSNDIPLYLIEKVGPQVKNFHAGDIIVVNSTGTKIEFDNVDYFLFKEENVMGKEM